MNNLSGKAITIILSVLYLGCASLPNEGRTTDIHKRYDQVREMISTKQDVMSLFGEPKNISTNNGGIWWETWGYESNTTSELVGIGFDFNRNGIVTDKAETVIYYPGGRATFRQTGCIAYTENGGICGKPATVFDDQRGPLCALHARKPEIKDGTGKAKRPQPKVEID
jgi:hypothetical protein